MGLLTTIRAMKGDARSLDNGSFGGTPSQVGGLGLRWLSTNGPHTEEIWGFRLWGLGFTRVDVGP